MTERNLINRRLKLLKQQVERVLLAEWDLLDVSDEPKAQDEYDSYAAEIMRMLRDQRSADDLFEYLVRIEMTLTREPANLDRARRVAELIIAAEREVRPFHA